MTKFHTITVRLNEDQFEALEKMRKQTGRNQSELIRQMIDRAEVSPLELSTSVTMIVEQHEEKP